jgi:hypothetical protein
VASLKFLISQNPKIAIILFPGNIGSTSPPLLIFYAMISAPASPNPSANKAPVLIISFSRIVVSNFYSSYIAAISLTIPFLRSSSIASASYSSI